MPRLSVIIVNYGPLDVVIPCIEPLRDESGSNRLQVIMVDNATPGFDAASFQQRFPWVELIAAEQNRGFSAGNNLGIRQATGEYVLLLNPDTRVTTRALFLMVEYLELNPGIGAATCRVNLANGKLDPACHRGFPTPWASLTYFLKLDRVFPRSRVFGRYHLTWLALDTAHEIDSPSGCFFIVRRKVIDQVGLLDEAYFLYGEDLDWAKRIRDVGWKIMFNPAMSITHLKGQVSGIKETSGMAGAISRTDQERAFSAFYAAMRIFYRKHYWRRYFLPVNWGVMLSISIQQCIRRYRLKV